MFVKRTPFVEQMQQTECGLCCISMIAGKYNANRTLRELRNMAGIGRDGVTLFTMRNLAVRLGFEAKVFRMDLNQLSQVRLPAIAYWNESHYVVVDKINKNSVKIIDPAIGRRKVTWEEFQESYSSVVLEMSPTEGISPGIRSPYPASSA
ncbi:cysteine peptidase family C39 domain-containing protein [Paenibacillus sp. MZ04-78.2]|uniref:cysteine peptidase family C39 domain-containing protein n=1 Tax=Paenibacillus sp. MZ04-78.2 TaxID=2962034 RepID=UPI0020B792B0|nr:cysteine peptidase family C39 domain-containing protein [Paenibacillus sp. MZ04-78.2]MCP3773175.1 cysteine peptidase family C39 domain-containing protein [Paenibacillus sp. MZ04-78.2]